MTRKKVKLQYIPNDSARKATFKKRKKGLVKKVNELTTLCGIEACAIIYSPYDAQPEVWPSPVGVQRVLSKFKKLPEMEQSKKMVNQESFLNQRLGKASEQLKKLCKDNREKEMTQVMNHGLAGGLSMAGFTMRDVNDLGWVVDQTLKNVSRRIADLTKGGPSGQNNSNNNNNNNPKAEMVGPSDAKPTGEELEMHHSQWFMDMMNSHASDNTGFGAAGVWDDIKNPLMGGDGNPSSSNTNIWSNQFYP